VDAMFTPSSIRIGHWNHTGSNERLAKTGQDRRAREYKLWLGADFYGRLGDGITSAAQGSVAYPRRSKPSGKLTAGKRGGRVRLLPRAHTEATSYVFFPKSNVLVAGGSCFRWKIPTLDY